MKTFKDLEERIEAINNIYFSAKVSFSDTEYLYIPDNEEEKKLQMRTSLYDALEFLVGEM